jgi:hypothetical protein
VENLATHGLSCKKNPGKYSRHAALNDIIKRACASANIPSILEPSGTFRDDGKRPDGLTLIPWSRGRSLLWDATCVDTLAATYIQATSRKDGAAAATAETKKFRTYASVSDRYIFCPVAVETLGPFGEHAMAFIQDLGKRLKTATGEPRSTAFLTQRISLAIQRGNASSVLATIPPSSKFHEIFYL